MQLRGTLSWTWGLRSLGQTLGIAGWIFYRLRKRQEVRGFGWVRSQLWLGESSLQSLPFRGLLISEATERERNSTVGSMGTWEVPEILQASTNGTLLPAPTVLSAVLLPKRTTFPGESLIG